MDYRSLVPDESRRSRIISWVKLAARWRARSNRQIWLVTLTAMLVACAAAIVMPSARPTLLCFVIGLAAAGWLSTEGRRARREREALAKRLAILPRDGAAADVIDLLLVGKKIQAIRRYRELTGTDLAEAKAFIDSL